MRAITLTQNPPCSELELDQFARMMRVDMPHFQFDGGYLQFIRTTNGGKPVEKYFRIPSGDVFSIDAFLNFADVESSEEDVRLFNVHQNWNWIEDRLLPGMFPFAALSGGDYLILNIDDDKDSAHVTLWYHEKSSEASPHLQLISDSFDSFLTMLVVEPG